MYRLVRSLCGKVCGVKSDHAIYLNHRENESWYVWYTSGECIKTEDTFFSLCEDAPSFEYEVIDVSNLKFV